MILYPAIDLKDGKCVRLLRGEMDKATVFSDKPHEQAKRFEEAGFHWLHLVDLNGAFEGKPVNAKAVSTIITNVNMLTQLGGGIRDMETIENWLSVGINRVILGTIALKNPALVINACRAFPDQIAVGIDAKGGKAATDGWAKVSEMSAIDLALKFEDAGVSAIIYTDINRDGAMQGPNIEETAKLAERLSTPVILSGGISKLSDIADIKKKQHAGIEGVIIGRALYDGAIDPREALKTANSNT
ncbi:MAG TPA: 1-(5-phosphoribosyl)-5-[(5-phosphoribosylamino)methylideneamino]imidazole-4-carboxamide isomerase [Rickettsiales bacterium]|nr:1-(5-phosphoribosyl)-5-[(5-phosphoribosylamino)methylideneamino]imidazole-4-carboxamide isomerase [Rickettsiales bacterium]